MIKIIRRSDGWCSYVHGTTALAYKFQAKKSHGKIRWCKTVAKSAQAQAYAALRAVLAAGDMHILYSVEDDSRREVVLELELPVAHEDAIKKIENECKKVGSIF